MVGGQVNVNNDTGTANLNYSVSGPKGKGVIRVTGEKAGGAWTYSLMQLTVEGTGETIDLLAGP